TARCRVIAATNRDLRRAVREGAFRADLYHRLSVFTLSVPPLRELDQDKLLLLDHFRKNAFELDPAATERWLRYGFPGNVRELRNIVLRLSAKYPGQRISVAELEAELDVDSAEPGAGRDSIADQALRQLERGAPFDLDQTLKAWERGYIEAALRLTRGNVTQAAKLLGINRTTLYSRMGSDEK
ncbi:MAG TPA: helix-turn-helix domain-containing protein, partial [Burkholderiales bacterium]|nr:helix-turn-helix domain-containing protein [Burkholderiales bacterium]